LPRIALVSEGKSRAAIDATCGERRGVLVSGRMRDIERSLATGIIIGEGILREAFLPRENEK
jgi:hypothetical protein